MADPRQESIRIRARSIKQVVSEVLLNDPFECAVPDRQAGEASFKVSNTLFQVVSLVHVYSPISFGCCPKEPRFVEARP